MSQPTCLMHTVHDMPGACPVCLPPALQACDGADSTLNFARDRLPCDGLDRVTSTAAGVLPACHAGQIQPRGVATARCLIEQAVAQVFGVHPVALASATRGCAPAARARQVAMYVTHVACGMNFTEVGILFARDRTTVSHACAVIEDCRDDTLFDRVIELLEWIVPALLERIDADHEAERPLNS